MNGFSEGSEEDGIGGAKAVKPSSAEVKLMLRIIAALNMIRMCLGMYPPGHAKIAESFDSAFAVIQTGLKQRSEWTLSVTTETLMFGEAVLDKKNTSVRDYLRTLNNLRILSLGLHRGLKKKDLIEFNRILSSKPSDIWAQGKIEGILIKAGVESIKVKEADAGIYSLAGGIKMTQDEAKKKMKGETFWQDYISRLKTLGHLDSKEAARILSEQRQHWQAFGVSYEGMIQDYFQGVREGRKISAEHYENLAKVSSFIKDLHPDLKKQFLEVVERQISLQPESALVLENIKCFPQEIFLAIVSEANEKKSQISPALVMILQKISNTEKGKAIGKESGEDISHEDMGKLLKREEHEKYVPVEYDQILKKAVQTSQMDSEIDEEKFPIHEYLKTITEAQTGVRICQFLLALMDEETTEEVYLVCATGLMRVVPELIQSGQFHVLTDVIETLRRHGREGGKPSEIIRQKAISSLKLFSDQKHMEKQVAPFIMRGLADPGRIVEFLTACGSQNVPWLFDLYLDPLSPASAVLADILQGFGRNAVDEALKRLSGQTPQGIVQLLTFLRAAADPSIVPSLKDLFDHEDWSVRREVIETLLHYNDPAAVVLLRKSLGSKNREELFNAVSLASRYRVADLIDDLMNHLKTFVIREEDTILNDWIIKQLGATGDPAFLPCLEKISRIRFSLTPKQLSRMKLILYGSLIHFPRDSVQKMLERGKRSYNRKIRACCAKILER